MSERSISSQSNPEPRRLRITSAHVVAVLALFVAFGGGAYAAKVKLKANSVKTKTIKNGAVTEPKLASGAVTAAKIAGGAVGPAQIAPISYQPIGGFLNSWAAAGDPVEIGKDALGFVHLRGGISGGTFGMVALTLPEGFRPARNASLPAVSGGATPSINRIDILTSGDVLPQGTVNTNVSLDQVTFLAG
jgi:hypothetical protein